MTYQLCFGISLGSSKTGLTLAAQLVDTTGANSGSEVTTGFAEIGTGTYLWNYVSIPDAFRGGVKFYESGVPATILAFAGINPEEAEYTDAKTSTRSFLAQSDILADETPFNGGDIAAILADTGTDGVKLANDAITSAKFDESTAFPLASADTGATQVARVGADGDTLETLSDEIAVVDANVDAILLDTGTDGVILTAAGIQAIFNATLPEGYAADGAAMTLAQSQYETVQFHNERVIANGTITVYKRDGVTPAFTLTFDADSITRAT